MVSYSIMTLTPQAFYYAPILLPFAVGNGVVAGRGRPSEDPARKLSAGSLYLVADKIAGGPEVSPQASSLLISQALAHYQVKPLSLPLFGPALGATTAMLVPYTYPFCQGLAVWKC